MVKKNEKKKKSNIKIYELIFIVGALLILMFVCINTFGEKLDYHCKNAVCNNDNTMCFTYSTSQNATITTWKGSCVKKETDNNALIFAGVFASFIVGVLVIYLASYSKINKEDKALK